MAMQYSSADFVFETPLDVAAPRLIETLTAVGATNFAPHSPGTMQFRYKYKNFLKTGALGLVMAGQMSLQDNGQAGVSAKIDLKIDWGANSAYLALLAFGTVVLVYAVLAWLNQNGSSLTSAGLAAVVIVAVAIPGLSLFRLTRMAQPARLELLALLRQRLAQGPVTAAPFAPAPQPAKPAAPPPIATPPASPPPTAPSDVRPAAEAPSGASVVEKIKQLGQLRDAGLITDADFDYQKTELLKKL